MASKIIRIAVTGPPQSGKTKYVHRLVLNEYTDEYSPTTHLTPYQLYYGSTSFIIIDCPPMSIPKVDAAIVMHDMNHPYSLIQAIDLVQMLHIENPGIPIVLTGSKADESNRYLGRPDEETCVSLQQLGVNIVTVYDVSSVSQRQIEEPLAELTKFFNIDHN